MTASEPKPAGSIYRERRHSGDPRALRRHLSSLHKSSSHLHAAIASSAQRAVRPMSNWCATAMPSVLRCCLVCNPALLRLSTRFKTLCDTAHPEAHRSCIEDASASSMLTSFGLASWLKASSGKGLQCWEALAMSCHEAISSNSGSRGEQRRMQSSSGRCRPCSLKSLIGDQYVEIV